MTNCAAPGLHQQGGSFVSTSKLAAGSLLLFSLVLGLPAQQPPSDPTALVRTAVQHRLDEDKSHHPLRYTLRKRDTHLDTTKEIVETKDGDVARLVAINGKPLSPDAAKAEQQRLDALAANPAMQARRQRSEQRDKDRVTRILGLLPDALVYKFEGTVACGTGECYRMSFAPKPGWNPPDLESELLKSVAGEVWIDKQQVRLVRLDAKFIADANFGFGILAHINQGGTVRLEQSNVGGNDWELTGLTTDLTGKALLFKSINIQIREEASNFSEVPEGLSYRDAIHLLESGPAETK